MSAPSGHCPNTWLCVGTAENTDKTADAWPHSRDAGLAGLGDDLTERL